MIGFTIEVNADATNLWVTTLMKAIAGGSSVAAAMAVADSVVGDSAISEKADVGANNRYVVGDTSIIPFP